MSPIRVEFQLTYDEYIETLVLARKRLLREVNRRSRREYWVGIAIFFIVAAFVLGRMIYWLLPSPTPAIAVAQSWQDSLRPYILFLVLVWMVVFGMKLLIRRRLKIINRLSWEGRVQLHQIRTAELSDAGVVFSDRFARTEYQWSIFRGLEETQQTFMLYISEFTGAYEIIPKRAFHSADELDRFRSLVEKKIEPQVTAFPVMPIPTSQPLPPPPLPASLEEPMR